MTALHFVQHLLFFATHEMPDRDIRYYRHVSRQLKLQPAASARMWVLVYSSELDHVRASVPHSEQIDAGVAYWGDGALRRALPKLARAVNGPPATSERNPNHRRYYWFHSSLLLWNLTFGHAYPSLSYWWRIEPDVLFSGSWADLVMRSDYNPYWRGVDLLLPRRAAPRQPPRQPAQQGPAGGRPRTRHPAGPPSHALAHPTPTPLANRSPRRTQHRPATRGPALPALAS